MIEFLKSLGRKMSKKTDDQLEDVAFPTIGGDDPIEGGEKSNELSLEALKSQFDSLKAESEATKEFNRELLDRMDQMLSGAAGRPGGAVEPSTSAPALPKLEDLPDPKEKPEEFRRGVSDFIQQSIAAATTRSSQDEGQRETLNTIYADFAKENPDIAGHDLVIRGLVQQETAAMQRQGIKDPAAAIIANPDRFKRKIAKATREYLTEKKIPFGQPAGGEDDDDDDVQVNRTAGVKGGSTQKSNGKVKDPMPATFMETLKKRQQATGLF